MDAAVVVVPAAPFVVVVEPAEEVSELVPVVVVVTVVVVVVLVVVVVVSTSSVIVTFDAEESTPTSPVITPLIIWNTMSVVTSYPAGAASSWRVYVPSGRSLTNVESEPEIHVRLLLFSVEMSCPSVPITTLSMSNTTGLPVRSVPVSVSCAPGTSPPSTLALLIAISVSVKSSVTVTVLSLMPVEPVTTPSWIVNSMIVVTSYPEGAAISSMK